MAANLEFRRVDEWSWLRGWANLARKERRAWLRTRRWWINALLWPLLLCGLVANMIYMPSVTSLATPEQIAQVGGVTPYAISMGLSLFFEFGLQAVGIGVILLCLDLVIEERQSGVAEWLLTKPVTRRAYVLAKLPVNAAFILLFLVAIPALVTYGLLYVRAGAPTPPVPFLSAVGIMALHTLFYVTLMVMLGVLFTSRPPIVGIALGLLLGGNLLASLFKPILYVTPLALGKVATLVAGSQPVPLELFWLPLISTILGCLVFTFTALLVFERTEF